MRYLLICTAIVCLLCSCSKDDSAKPDPNLGLTLSKWTDVNFQKDGNGQWKKDWTRVRFFKYNKEGLLHMIEDERANVNQNRYTFQYDQGKFIGVGHHYLHYRLLFNEGRLRRYFFGLPDGNNYSNSHTDTIIYGADGKLQEVRRIAEVSSFLSKAFYYWNGDDLHKVVFFEWKGNGQWKEGATYVYEYDDKLLPLSFSKLPEGMEYFILSTIFWEYRHFRSRHLVKTITQTYPASQLHTVWNYTHNFDEKGRLKEIYHTELYYDGVVLKEEKRNAVLLHYIEN